MLKACFITAERYRTAFWFFFLIFENMLKSYRGELTKAKDGNLDIKIPQ